MADSTGNPYPSAPPLPPQLEPSPLLQSSPLLTPPSLALLVYAFGSNASGQLGIGHTTDVAQPQKCRFRGCDEEGSSSPNLGEVRKIVAGGNHTLLLTVDGRLFSAGRFGGASREEEESSVEFVPQTLLSTQGLGIGQAQARAQAQARRLTDVAATWEASFVVVDNKVVFGYGAGPKGELGLGENVLSTHHMTKVFDVSEHYGIAGEDGNCEIVDIQASMSHVVLVLSNGHVFAWGTCRKGQLGDRFKDNKVLWRPTRIDHGFDGVGRVPFQAEKVALGREYTAFLRSGEKMVIWGVTKLFDDADLNCVLEEGASVASGWSSIHVLSPAHSTHSWGQVKGVGRNNHGQLAPANLPAVVSLAAGSEHCLALAADNQVIAWGWGEHGNCGEESDPTGTVAGRWNVIPLPPLREGVQLKSVAAGCATSFVICGNKG